MKGNVLVFALGLFAAEAAADDLGRLFTTVDERVGLEVSARPTPARSKRPIILQGVLLRRDGVAFAWIDDRPFQRGASGAGFRLIEVGAEGVTLVRDQAVGQGAEP